MTTEALGATLLQPGTWLILTASQSVDLSFQLVRSAGDAFLVNVVRWARSSTESCE